MNMRITYRLMSAGLVFLTFREVDGNQSLQQAMTPEEAEPFKEGTIWDVEIKKTLVKAAE